MEYLTRAALVRTDLSPSPGQREPCPSRHQSPCANGAAGRDGCRSIYAKIQIRFSEWYVFPALVECRAWELDIIAEQLVKRFICAGMQDDESESGPAVPGEILDDFLVKRGG